MEQISKIDDISSKTSELEFITRGWIWASTFIGGPFAGCYFIGRNFKTMGRDQQAKQWNLIGIGATILLVALMILIPEAYMKHIPNSIIPLIYTLMLESVFTSLQAKNVKAYMQAGAIKYPWYKIIGISLASMVITMIVLMAAAAFL